MREITGLVAVSNADLELKETELFGHASPLIFPRPGVHVQDCTHLVTMICR